ncbi:MAG: site-2 protease family protein [Pseudomonadota bacterium]
MAAPARSSGGGGDDDPPLPPLREDLRLFDGPANGHGAPQRVIYDPIAHRYFTMDHVQARLLGCWRAAPPEAVVADATRIIGNAVSREDLDDLHFFLRTHGLVDDATDTDAPELYRQWLRGQKSWLHRVVHGYLFFRLPLVRPERFLRATYPAVAFLFTRTAWAIIILAGALGLYVASRQWEAFVATFLSFLSLEGAAAFGISLVVVKVLHELGHAYTAIRHGVRVTTMGVAFMVLMPLAYTDVTDAWRLPSHRKRLQIDAAGMLVELAVACLATLAWAFLPDGPLRAVAFVLATTGWVLSLLVNLNPFMKFDGYYLLVDGLQIPNLQARSFALGRWWLREALFDLRHPRPDVFPMRESRGLAIYGMAVWLYRLILFIGIALIVYHLFFKLLGVALFAVEILFFILLPVSRELDRWWELRSEIMSRRRTLITAGTVLAGVGLLLVPVGWSVRIPAVLEAGDVAVVYPPRTAKVVVSRLDEGADVRRGEIIAELTSPDLDQAEKRAQLSLALAEMRLARMAGDAGDLAERTPLLRTRAARLEELKGIARQRRELFVRAPIDGTLRDTTTRLHPGDWVRADTLLTRVVATQPAGLQVFPEQVEASREGVVAPENTSAKAGATETAGGKADTAADATSAAAGRGYVVEDHLARLRSAAQATFIPDDPTRPRRTARITEIDLAGAETLSVPYLASVHGGAIPSEVREDNQIRSRRSQFLLRFTADGAPPRYVSRGVLRIDAMPEPMASRIWRRVLQVLVREAGI